MLLIAYVVPVAYEGINVTAYLYLGRILGRGNAFIFTSSHNFFLQLIAQLHDQ